jgi:hypothetical protein
LVVSFLDPFFSMMLLRSCLAIFFTGEMLFIYWTFTVSSYEDVFILSSLFMLCFIYEYFAFFSLKLPSTGEILESFLEASIFCWSFYIWALTGEID